MLMWPKIIAVFASLQYFLMLYIFFAILWGRGSRKARCNPGHRCSFTLCSNNSSDKIDQADPLGHTALDALSPNSHVWLSLDLMKS